MTISCNAPKKTISCIMNSAHTTGVASLTALRQFPMLNKALYESMRTWIDLELGDPALQEIIREHGLKPSSISQMTLNYLMIRLRNFKGCSAPMVAMDVVLKAVHTKGPEHALALLEAHVKHTVSVMCRKFASQQAAA